jgi:UDP-N-acetyl-D-mannosaminuronic acid dehydrogenase
VQKEPKGQVGNGSYFRISNQIIRVIEPVEGVLYMPSNATDTDCFSPMNILPALVPNLDYERRLRRHRSNRNRSNRFRRVKTAHNADSFAFDVCIVGGCGHVGLPLAITMASQELKVCVHDINDHAIALVRSGQMPFLEAGAETKLREVIGRSLEVANDPTLVTRSRVVVIITGTPVDEHLNPTYHVMRRTIGELLPLLVDGQCLILRSTVYPGMTDKVRELVSTTGRSIHVAFCPERVAEGKAMEELTSLPQIIAGCDNQAISMAENVFAQVAASTIYLSPLEAELTKIFANVWRYIQFAIANQFFMIATDYGLDFYRIYDALTRDYPRMAGLPKSGFAAGPCLFKDTMQLGAATNNNFALGHAAMLINEGLPNFLVRYVKDRYVLNNMCIGILGMAFKADSDDARESLSYKLRKILQYEAAEVLCTDVYIKDPDFRTLDQVIEKAELLFIGAPHREYQQLKLPSSKLVIDIWNMFGRGVFPS